MDDTKGRIESLTCKLHKARDWADSLEKELDDYRYAIIEIPYIEHRNPPAGIAVQLECPFCHNRWDVDATPKHADLCMRKKAEIDFPSIQWANNENRSGQKVV